MFGGTFESDIDTVGAFHIDNDFTFQGDTYQGIGGMCRT